MEQRYDYIIVGAGSAGCVLADSVTSYEGSRLMVTQVTSAAAGKFLHLYLMI